jgi:hypothetical protein
MPETSAEFIFLSNHFSVKNPTSNARLSSTARVAILNFRSVFDLCQSVAKKTLQLPAPTQTVSCKESNSKPNFATRQIQKVIEGAVGFRDSVLLHPSRIPIALPIMATILVRWI